MPETTEASRLDTLRTIPLFAELPDEGLKRVLDRATEFEAGSGHTLVQPNHPGSGLFVIEEGSVVVELPAGRTVELGPGEFFGELALLDEGALHVARVRAHGPVRCLAVSRDDFDALLAEEPSLALSMLRTLARRIAADTRHHS